MSDLDIRRERAAHNQSVFREVNERIAAISNRYAEELLPIAYLCECLDTKCTETVELSPSAYEALRADGHRFVVLPGHEEPAVEATVEETLRYLIVEKVGVGRTIAETMDPRHAGRGE